MTGLPLGDASLHSDAVMVNILGDSWFAREKNDALEPLWNKVLSHANLKLHLYGKHEPRKARKMGHFTVIDKKLESALNVALIARSELNIG
jgi:5-(carboxyamino)imidazole ribonucleotide synthase